MQANTADDFLSFCTATGLSWKTVRKYGFDMATIRKHLGKPLERLRRCDCDGFFSSIENEGYSEATKNHYKLTIRKFLRWRFGEVPEFVKPYLKVKEYNIIRPLKFMLDEKDLLRILELCRGLQEKTLFGILMETGCRIDELLGCRRSEVAFDRIGALIVREGKGGRLRRIRIIRTARMLRGYVNKTHGHPEDRLFPYTYDQVKYIISRRISKRLGMHITPHMFRKVAATRLANHMTEYQLCQTMGWVPGSKMARHYVFLSGRDVDPVLKKVNGKEWS